MSKQELIKLLKSLKEIQPSAKYAENSRFIILNTPTTKTTQDTTEETTKNGYHFYNKLIFSIEGLSLALILLIGGTYYIKHRSQQNFIAKANETNHSIQIKIQEITSHFKNDNNSNNQTSKSKQSSDKIIPLIETTYSLLNTALTDLQNNNTVEFLAKLKAAEEILQKVENLTKNNQ
jgi:hypothetical protein